jgi:hypothetical protein
MKEELQSKLVEILTSMQTVAGKAGDFAMAELPDIAQSYVMYGRAVSIAKALCLLLMAFACFMAFLHAYRNPWNISPYSCDKDKARSESNQLMMVLGAVLGCVFVFFAFASFNLLVWFAPKVWLLKEIASLLK